MGSRTSKSKSGRKELSRKAVGRSTRQLNDNRRIVGSHEEHHLKVIDGEKASQVRVQAGLHQLKQVYNVDRNVLGKGAFGKVYKASDR